MRVARVLAWLAAAAFLVGLGATFTVTYRDQARRLARTEDERDDLQRKNARLASSLASAQTALTTLTAGLAATRADVQVARAGAGAAFLDGYAQGWEWEAGGDPYGSADALDAGSATGFYGR